MEAQTLLAWRQSPLVSIVINNYNYGQYLKAAIESAVQQTYSHVEVIVVDDGSTDKSREIIRSFDGQIYPVLKENGGQGSAYNAGFAASRGELILFLDSDDTLDPRALEEVVKQWEPGVAKIHFYLAGVLGPDAKRTDLVIPNTQLSSGDVWCQVWETGNYASPPASGNVYARYALAQIFPMPEAEWKIAADTYPIYLVPFFGTVKSCESALVKYRIHNSANWLSRPWTGTKLRGRLAHEVNRDRLIRTFCSARGIPYAQDRLEQQSLHLKTRLASLAIDPARHPFAKDRKRSLAGRLCLSLWKTRETRASRRLLLSLWAIALIAVPTRWRQYLVDIAFDVTVRPRSVHRLTRLATGPQS